MKRQALQIFLTVLGAVAFGAGMFTVLWGVSSVPDHGRVVPSLDSEIRFYAVWYAVAGIVLLRAVRKVEEAGTIVRAVAAAAFVAGCARLLSLAVVGKPHPTQVALMVVELLLPLVLVPWQAAVARQGSPEG